MNCSGCGYENADDAVCCNLCQLVLRKETPAAPPAPAPAPASPGVPGEPATLDAAQSIADILLLALKQGTANNFDEAERLMSRIFLEADPLLARDLLGAAGDAWMKVASGSAKDSAQALLLVKACAAAGMTGDHAKAAEMSAAAAPLITDLTSESFRLQLLLMGVRGASKRGGRKAAPAAASATGEPEKLTSIGTWAALISLAQKHALTGNLNEAMRLTTRLFCELALGDCETLLVVAGDAWLESSKLAPAQKDAARGHIAAAGKAAKAEDFEGARAALTPALMMVDKDDVGPGMKLALLGLGLKGAAARKKPAPSMPPPGAANTPRY